MESESVVWDETLDFLVVGSGAAGMTAAIRAHDLGASTLVVEKAATYGGSTALSGGVIWVPGNPLMKDAGIEDSPEEGLRYLEQIVGDSSPIENLRAYVETAPLNASVIGEEFRRLTMHPPAYMIFDARCRHSFPLWPILPGRLQPDWALPKRFWKFVTKDGTLEGLAGKWGIEAEGLRRTVDRFNEAARTGKDPDFGRGEAIQDRYYSARPTGPNPSLGEIREGPFYAVKIWPGDIGTKGGMRTDACASAGWPEMPDHRSQTKRIKRGWRISSG